MSKNDILFKKVKQLEYFCINIEQIMEIVVRFINRKNILNLVKKQVLIKDESMILSFIH
jgi:hypothetical protein